MARVKTESRNRIGIDWYDSEAEADAAAEALKAPEMARRVAEANIGIVQCGRASYFDQEVDGRMAYAVVTP